MDAGDAVDRRGADVHALLDLVLEGGGVDVLASLHGDVPDVPGAFQGQGGGGVHHGHRALHRRLHGDRVAHVTSDVVDLADEAGVVDRGQVKKDGADALLDQAPGHVGAEKARAAGDQPLFFCHAFP